MTEVSSKLIKKGFEKPRTIWGFSTRTIIIVNNPSEKMIKDSILKYIINNNDFWYCFHYDNPVKSRGDTIVGILEILDEYLVEDKEGHLWGYFSDYVNRNDIEQIVDEIVKIWSK